MSAEPQRTINWNFFEDKILEGGYEVQNCLQPGPQSATFQVRILGDRFTKAIATAFPPGTVPSEQLVIWEETLELRHDYLNVPLSVGEMPLDGTSAAYVITVAPDETLECVLRERALSPEEARQVVDVAVDALEYLHLNGFVHSALSPAEIQAIGDGIRLSSIRLRRGNAPLPTAPFPAPKYQAPEAGTTGNISRAADVYCLGCSVFEILTRKPAGTSARERASSLPAPFGPFVESALNPDPAARCRIPEIREILAGRIPERLRPAPVVIEPESAPVEAIAAPPVAAVLPDDPAPVRPVAASSAAANTPLPDLSVSETKTGAASKPAGPPSLAEEAGLASPKVDRSYGSNQHSERATHRTYRPAVNVMEGKRLWIYGGGLVAIALLATLFARDHHRTAAHPAASSQAAWPSHVVEPAPQAAAPPASTAAAPSVVTSHAAVATPAAAANWRVIAYTFNREADAIRRVEAIKEKHPGLEPQVFSPGGHKAPFLIALGGPVTRDQAERLRQKARAEGMPRDTFIRNYTR